MRRVLMLTTVALVASLLLAPAAGAQEMMEEKMMDDSMMMEQSKMEQPKMEQPKMMEKKGKMEMPMTGGPSLGLLLLPAAALLVGMGLMAGYVVRRRR